LPFLPQYYWEVFGAPVFKWKQADITLTVREAPQNVSNWYQSWDAPIVETREVRSYNPLVILLQQDRDYYTKIDFNATPIFDALVRKYGNKGAPNPRDPSIGRIITLADGQQVVLHTFGPRLKIVVTYYDKDGSFLGHGGSVSFEKDEYERWLEQNGGYFIIHQSTLDFPYGAKIHSAKAFVELIPDD
jgi:hypothetical protein